MADRRDPGRARPPRRGLPPRDPGLSGSSRTTMRNTFIIFRRELTGYFITPLAYIFIVIFLATAGTLTFFVGNFFNRGQADLEPFFGFHPWLYLILIPAITMRLWAEERKTGTVELLLTLPISMTQAVLGKFLAAWVFAGIALALTFPMWITVNVLGSPDNGAILAAYGGSWLMAGAVLAVGAAVSPLAENQGVAFGRATARRFIFTVNRSGLVRNFFSGRAPTLAGGAGGALCFR